MNLSCSEKGSSSCQCTTTLYGENEETQKKCETNSVTDANYAPRFPFGRWSFWDLDQRRNGTELILINQMEIGTRLLNE